MKAHILILNHNGADLLYESLPSVLAAQGRSDRVTRVSVIDNESTDGSVDMLKVHFPSVNLFQKTNRVLCSYNDVVARVDEEVVVLLNNDLKVAPDFADPLLAHFDAQPNLFLAAPKCLNYDGSAVQSELSDARLSFGLLRVEGKPVKPAPDRALFTFAAGSAGAYRRDRFLELQGYDELYLPGTMEDIDLCLRAWRKGYFCLYEPSSIVFHKGQASFHRKFGSRRTRQINARNNFLFMWKNFSGARFWMWHLFCLPVRIFGPLLKGRIEWVTGFLEALKFVPRVLKKRGEIKTQGFAMDAWGTLSFFTQKSGRPVS